MDKAIIEKMVILVLNLRATGFTGCSWEDIQATTGELSPGDKATLTDHLIGCDGWQDEDGWDLRDLDIEMFKDVTLLTDYKPEPAKSKPMGKVPGGQWFQDERGRWIFKKTPGYTFKLGDVEGPDSGLEGEGDEQDADNNNAFSDNRNDNPRGRIRLGLNIY
jgi:hypothetical protein